MNMVDAVKSVLTQYVGFGGRARRSEFWYWKLATILASIVVGVIDTILGLGADGSGPISLLLTFAIFIPDLAVTVRRLHDTGRSGWWVGGFYLGIVGFVLALSILAFGTMAAPAGDTTAAVFGVFGIVFGLGILIYAITMLVFLCTDSSIGPNKYGPNPKNEGNYDVFE